MKIVPYWDIHVLHFNFLGRRFDYKKTWLKRKPNIISEIKLVKPDIITGVECAISEAKEISTGTGYGFVNYLGSTIFYRKGLKVNLLKKFSWLKNYPHSALVCEVTNEAGRTINVTASHLPPFSYRASLRKREQGELCGLFIGWSDASIICTDANWSKTFESYIKSLGWVSARLVAASKFMANFKTSSALQSTLFRVGNPIDYVIAKAGKTSPVKVILYKVRDGRGKSDHNFVEVVIRCGKYEAVPTN
jgi:hypothetical protein